MAEIAVANSERASHYTVLTWEGASNGGSPDTFESVKLTRIPYAISVQVTGTFTTSAAIALHGSIDGTNYAALNDYSDSAISLTAAGLADCAAAPLYIRPVLTSGDGSTDIDVTMLVWFESR